MGVVKETHKATVVNDRDPDKQGRIRIASATLMGTDENGEALEWPEFIPPKFPALFSSDGEKADAGIFFVPSVGVVVEVELNVASSYDQVPGQTALTDPDMKWVSCVLVKGDSIPEEFKTNYPRRMGWKSRSGHILMFDDSDRVDGVLELLHRNGSGIQVDNDATVHLGRKSRILSFVALALRVDGIFSVIDAVIRTLWVPVPGDGGLALKIAYIAAFPSAPSSTAANRVKAE